MHSHVHIRFHPWFLHQLEERLISFVSRVPGSPLPLLLTWLENPYTWYAFFLPIFLKACLESPTAIALLIATISKPGQLFLWEIGRCTTTFLNCFPCPTVMPWLLWIDSDLQSCNSMALIEQHFLSHLLCTKGIASLTAQIHVYFGDVTWEQSHATTHIGQILLGVSHTQLDSAHTSALLTAQHMTHRRFTLVSATKFKHKHQTDLCATSLSTMKPKRVHATQQ